MREVGPLTTFMSLPVDEQREYIDVSVMELAAYVSWLSARSRGSNAVEDWGALDSEKKSEWVPDNPRAALQKHVRWARLL